ncbi:SCAN domain-containing protein 3 [Labeo rohita]|uniref:SCAN domain-containing protein 3 n=1 Tax=Labeo rohita TaxID=84645 RepID=A0ABQ8L9F9_LABRO|nr:SCAN domain-containing protein 3 [Labeo rohita]
MDKFITRTKRSCDEDASSAPTPKKCKTQKYDISYLQLGFKVAGTEAEPLLQCVICADLLAHDSMKPCKLKHHLETKHLTLKDKPLDFFKLNLSGLEQQKCNLSKHTSVSNRCLDTSYYVSKPVAKLEKPYTIAEALILPAAKDVEVMFGENFAQQISDILLSNDTVSRRMASDIKEQLLANMQSQYYALQLDETTDVAGLAQLLTYVRYVKNDNIEEDILFCRSLPEHTTGKALFEVLDGYLQDAGMSWDKCVGICTDRAHSMTGRISGLVTRVQNLAPLAKWTHCMIHRESLPSKKMRLFSLLCQELGAEHEQLLFHSEVRWLSRDRVLHCLYELRSEVKTFLVNVTKSDLAQYLDDPLCLTQLSYLVDIFDSLNSLNTSLQGRDANILLLSDKVSASLA